mmetsp:Transcript_16884/g.43035  ORF Transcript_16884/g.43035 Transcript_16884/m.43035 type:complete len:348 (+) Transcript_16884:117-1160(+)
MGNPCGGCFAGIGLWSKPRVLRVEALRGRPRARLPKEQLWDGLYAGDSRLRDDALFVSKYEIQAELGSGCSATVNAATHRETGDAVAVRALRNRDLSARQAQAIHEEVHIFLQLSHPNICKLVEIFCHPVEDSIYMVMELCSGGDLFDRLKSVPSGHFLEWDAADVVRQITDAVAYCHSNWICHRDLKLENFVYQSPAAEAPLKLIDFGLSTLAAPAEHVEGGSGTLFYCSPEVVRGVCSHKSDVWAVGVIAYMLLSGAPPFVGPDRHSTARKIRAGRFSFPDHLWDGVSTQAKAFVSALLRFEPEWRVTSDEARDHPWLSLEVLTPPGGQVAQLEGVDHRTAAPPR